MRGRMMLLSPEGRGDYLRKKKYFASIGKNVWYTPTALPTEGWLVHIGNNVVIASGAVLVTHDEIARVFQWKYPGETFEHHRGGGNDWRQLFHWTECDYPPGCYGWG